MRRRRRGWWRTRQPAPRNRARYEPRRPARTRATSSSMSVSRRPWCSLDLSAAWSGAPHRCRARVTRRRCSPRPWVSRGRRPACDGRRLRRSSSRHRSPGVDRRDGTQTPGPSMDLGGGRFELADMAERERSKERHQTSSCRSSGSLGRGGRSRRRRDVVTLAKLHARFTQGGGQLLALVGELLFSARRLRRLRRPAGGDGLRTTIEELIPPVSDRRRPGDRQLTAKQALRVECWGRVVSGARR